MVKTFLNKYGAQCWALGFVKGGIDAIMKADKMSVEWVRMPKDRWFADPFILEVTSKEIHLLVEDYAYSTRKGIISLLKINRATMDIISCKVLLDLPTHLSFPCILREDGHIYVYPENANGGRLDMYEYVPGTEILEFRKTICNDVIWDSCITDYFGERMLFSATHNDYILDIYKWDNQNEKFVPWQQVKSKFPNSRMGGQLFEYQDSIYYPAQDCSTNYGSAIDIKKIHYDIATQKFSFDVVKNIKSPHPYLTLGLHTINERNGVVVIDVLGYCYPILGKIIHQISTLKKNLTKLWRN